MVTDSIQQIAMVGSLSKTIATGRVEHDWDVFFPGAGSTLTVVLAHWLLSLVDLRL